MYTPGWRVELMGGLTARTGDMSVTRFRTRAVRELLAILAFYPRRLHSREELIELLWPNGDPMSGRVSLRTALVSLRRQIEPPGMAHGGVLITDRTYVRLNSEAVSTDVSDFQALVAQLDAIGAPEQRIQLLPRLLALYNGDLLPGYYSDWVLKERDRLRETYTRALLQCATDLEAIGEPREAMECAHRLIALEPLLEEAHCMLARLSLVVGNAAGAAQQHTAWKCAYKDAWGKPPPESLEEWLGKYPSASNTPELPGTHISEAGAQGRPINPRPFPSSQSSVVSPLVQQRPPITSSVPLPLSRVFGREREIADLIAMLRGEATVREMGPGLELLAGDRERRLRLVTLTGAGGMGKTRLAIEVAAAMAAATGEPAAFISLADVQDAERIPRIIADALGLAATDSLNPLEQVTAHLATRAHLLVLDSCEALLCGNEGPTGPTHDDGSAVLLVKHLLESCPLLTILVTSRRPLLADGEQEFPVAPLPTPQVPGTPARLAEFASVQLFVARAQAVRPDFQLTARNAAMIAAICHRLDGIPLALELAAAWIRTLAPSQLLSRLSSRFDLLTSTRKDLAPRHRALRATLEGSYAPLSPELKRFFASISVFRGGWTLEAAEFVAAQKDALQLLATLQECSLVQSEETQCGMRYRVLESLREFAAEHLQDASQTRRRHSEHFAALAEEAEPHLTGPNVKSWLERLEEEHDNLRAAQAWTLTAEGEIEIGLRIAACLWRFWYLRGHCGEARRWLTALLERVPATTRTPAYARALSTAGTLAHVLSDFAGAEAAFTMSLVINRELNNLRGVSVALSNLGIAVRDRGDLARARALQEEGLDVGRQCGDPKVVASSLNNLAVVTLLQRDHQAARRHLDEALDLKRSLGDTAGVALTLSNLGVLALRDGVYDQALRYQEESLTMRREIGDLVGTATSLLILGQAMLQAGDLSAARPRLEESLLLWHQVGSRQGVLNNIEALATIAAAERRFAQAGLLIGGAVTLLGSLDFTLQPETTPDFDALMQRVRVSMGSAEFDRVFERGRATPIDDLVRIALEGAANTLEAEPVSPD